MLSAIRNFFYLTQDIVGKESSECATRKRKAQSISSAITSWRKLSNILVVIPIEFMNFDKEIAARSKPYVTISDIVKILLNTNITWRPDMAPRCRYSQELSETSSSVISLHVCLHVCNPAVLIQFTYPHVCFDSVHVCDPSVLIQFTYVCYGCFHVCTSVCASETCVHCQIC